MEENDLQINITAVDDASSVIDGIAQTTNEMGNVVSNAIGSVNDSLTGMQDGITKTATTWAESMSELEDMMAEADMSAAGMASSIDGSLTGITAAQEYLAEVSSTSATEYQTNMDEMAVAAATAADEIESNLTAATAATSGLGSGSAIGFLALGAALKTVGQPIQDFYTSTVQASATAQTQISTLGTAVGNLVNQGNDLKTGTGEVTAIMGDLVDKINAQKAAINSLEVPMSGHNKTTAQLAADEANAAAQVQTHKDTLAQLEGQLDRFNNTATMASGNVADMTTQLEDQARKNTDLGFTYEESLQSLQQLTQETGSAKMGLQANADAMELSRSKNLSLSDATNAVSQAYNGQGRSLANIGIIIKDGVAGNASLAAISEQTANSVGNSMGTMSIQLSILNAKWNLFMTDIGNSQGGILGPLVKMLTEVITWVNKWADEHPRLTQVILLFVGVLGVLMVLVGSVLVIFGLMSLALGAAGAGWVLLGVVITAFVVTALAFLISNFESVKTTLSKWGVDVYEIVNFAFTKLWDAIKSIWNGIANTIQTVITNIENMINGVLGKIGAVMSAVGGIPGNIVSGASSVISGAIHAFADGGIVNGPTLAMVGEAGPEAIIPLSAFNGGSSLAGLGGGSGSGSNIIFNIGNLYGTDSSTATRFANQIAKSINQQLKLKNYN